MRSDIIEFFLFTAYSKKEEALADRKRFKGVHPEDSIVIRSGIVSIARQTEKMT